MTVRSGGAVAMAGLVLTLAGCGGGDGQTVARAAGTNGATVELPVPEASPSGGAPAKPSDTAAAPLTIGFAKGGATLDADARHALDRLAADPALAKGRLTLRGHSDSEGDDEANRRMSRRRAEAVRDYLTRKGVAGARISVIALGETRPIAPNARPDGSDDPAGRARNRRVEIELSPATS